MCTFPALWIVIEGAYVIDGMRFFMPPRPDLPDALALIRPTSFPACIYVNACDKTFIAWHRHGRQFPPLPYRYAGGNVSAAHIAGSCPQRLTHGLAVGIDVGGDCKAQ